MANLTIYPDHIKIRLVQANTLEVVQKLMGQTLNENLEADLGSVYRNILLRQLPHENRSQELMQLRERLKDFVPQTQTRCVFSCLED